MAGTAETVARKFRDVLDLATNGHLKAREIEGWPSGVSTDILAALVQGTERFYAGGGSLSLADLVAAVAPAVEPRVRVAFADALAAIRRIGSPVEVAAVANRPAVELAARIAKTLEVALKVDLASALGVTLTFTSGDGD
jgi:predicted lipoprotein